jgi:hypothetical protein
VVTAKKKAKATKEREPRKRKPDTLARAQAEMVAKPAASTTAVDALHVDSSDDVREWAAGFEADATPLHEPADDGTPLEEAPVATPEPSPVDILAAAAATTVAPAGRLVDPPGDGGPRQMLFADLPTRERRALASYASDWHCDGGQIEAFDAGKVVPLESQRARQGTRRLIELGLLVERTAYFLTKSGEEVARSGGITVTKPVVPDAAPVKVAS